MAGTRRLGLLKLRIAAVNTFRSEGQVRAPFADILHRRECLLSLACQKRSRTGRVLNWVFDSVNRGGFGMFQKRELLERARQNLRGFLPRRRVQALLKGFPPREKRVVRGYSIGEPISRPRARRETLAARRRS